MPQMGAALDEAAPGDLYHPYDEAAEEDTTAAQASEPPLQPPIADLEPEPVEQARSFSDIDIDEAPEAEAPVQWEPVGTTESLRWKKRPAEELEESPAKQSHRSASTAAVMMLHRKIGTMSAKLQRKLLDKEVPYSMISERLAFVPQVRRKGVQRLR